MIVWHIVTAAEFAAGNKVESDMYFLKDSKEIYRGTTPFTEAVNLYTGTLPTEAIAVNRLYIDSTTLEGKIWDGSKWTTVIKAVADTVAEDGTTPVSGKAVAAYVAAAIAGMGVASESVSSLSWDSAEHILTVTKGDNSSETITFDGLGVSLQYTASTGDLQLVDAKGVAIGDPIKLDLERFVTSGEYDADNKKIILYFDAEKTNSVEIDATGLVDTYTGEDSTTVAMSATGNVFKADVKISTASGNMITVDEYGIYVAPIDISGKMDKVADAVENNIATFGPDGQVIDSGKTFDDLAYEPVVFQGASIDEAVNGATPKNGDICITRVQIGETDKYERKVYEYYDSAWVPFDEHYDAKNVIIPNAFKVTTAFGKYVPDVTGVATVPGEMSIFDQLLDAFAQDTNPKIVKPSVTLTASQCKTYEVGTSVTPTYTVTFKAGTYEFNDPQSTGIVAKSYTVTDTEGNSRDTATGEFPALVVSDDMTSATPYRITAYASYDPSDVMPKTALGNDYTAGKIAAGNTTSVNSDKLYGYRKYFYGASTAAPLAEAEMTSDKIRALTGSSKDATKGTTIAISIPKGTQQVIIAYEASVGAIASIKDANDSNSEISGAFSMIEVAVEGANGYDTVTYRVYYMNIAGGTSADSNTYNVTI